MLLGIHDKSLLLRLLKWVMTASLVGTVGMLVLAVVLKSLGGVHARILLTFAAVFLGVLMVQVQLRTWKHVAGTAMSSLVGVGASGIFISQVSFLVLVWTGWTAWAVVWRVWWVSMVPAVLVTHLLILKAAASQRRGVVERLTAVCVVWVGLMILWLGLREDMFGSIRWTYLWVGVAPAVGTVAGSLYVVFRRLLVVSPGVGAKRAMVAGVLMSHLVLAVAGFYVGRATAGRTRELKRDPKALVDAAGGDLSQQINRDRYLLQSRFAEYLGDTRIIGRKPFITIEQIESLQGRLKPGDILLERRNWYLSNPFLPGFWPHAALYIGRIEDIGKIGVASHPSVRRHLERYTTPTDDGHAKTVIEAVSEGVIFNSLAHSMHADYVAVLRPRLSDRQIASAIVRAFEQLDKPYDFNFDFDDRRRVVCTQMVYLAYEGMIDFELKIIMGRKTLPAVEIARKYVAERERGDRQLDFVFFLDAVPSLGAANEAGEAAFCASIDRPRALVEK